jgi:hypothetical protein
MPEAFPTLFALGRLAGRICSVAARDWAPFIRKYVPDHRLMTGWPAVARLDRQWPTTW